MRAIMLGFALFSVLPAAASASPATPEEAARLAALFQSYLPAASTNQPAVHVTPRGDDYTVALDLGRALAPFTAGGVSITAGDIVAMLTPQADGRWAVHLDGLPPIGIVQGGQATSWTFDSYKADGVFDPAIRSFATLHSSNRGSESHATFPDGNSVDAKLVGTTDGTTTAVPAGDGHATWNGKSDAKTLTYGFVTVPAAGKTSAQSMRAEAHIDALASDLSWERMPTVALDELWRFIAAHPSHGALMAAQAELKDRLRALVPGTGPIASTVTLGKMSVDTTLGTFALSDFKQRFAIAPAGGTGVAPSLSLTFSGLQLPAGLAPPFAGPLVPTGLDLSLSYGPVELAAPALGAIDAIDMTATPPIEQARGRALLAWTGVGNAVVTVAPSTLTLPTMVVKFQGESRFATAAPSGSATISATGLDRTIAAVRAAGPNDPMGKQAVTVLLAAKALARADGADSYTWVVESAPGGAVTVNGTSLADIMPQGKQAKPAAP